MTHFDAIERLWDISREIRGMERVLFGKSALADELEIIVINLDRRLPQKTSAGDPIQQTAEPVGAELYSDTVNHSE